MAAGVLQGLDAMLSKLGKLASRAKAAATTAQFRLASDIAQLSDSRVPVATGALRGSRFIVQQGLRTAIGYSASYALPVHERTWVRHPNGQARFLASAFADYATKGRGLLAKYFIEEMGR